MKRQITILAVVVIAGASFAYVYHAHRKAAGHLSEGAPFSAPPGDMLPAGPTNPSPNSLDLVHQLPHESSAVVFVDVAALRSAPIGKQLASLAPNSAQDPQYTAFVRATGFDYSRDLDRAALALWPKDSPTTVLAFAEGKFNRAKIEKYAMRNGKVVKRGAQETFEVPEANSPRTVRFAFLSPSEIVLADGPAISEVLGPVRDRLDSQMSQRVEKVSGAPFYAVARTPDLAKDFGVDEAHSAQLARLLRSVHNISVAGLPTGQDLKISAAAECDSTLDALELSATLGGLVWMGRAALADPKARQQIGPQWPALDALLKAADISHESRFVRLRLRVTPPMLRAAAGSAAAGSAAR